MPDRCPGSNPIGDAGQDSTVRKPAKRRISNLRECLWVRLPSVLLIWSREESRESRAVRMMRSCPHPALDPRLWSLDSCASVGHWQASLAVNQPSKRTLAVQLRPGALDSNRLRRGAMLVFYSEAFNLANAGSIPVRVTGCGQVVEFGRHATLRRSCPQGRASSRLALATESESRVESRSRNREPRCWLWTLSSRLLTLLQVGRDPTGFHTAGVPGSIPGPATCGWASAHSGLISLDCRCATPGPAT